MCESVLAHRRAQTLIAEGAAAGKVLERLDRAVGAAAANQVLYQINYDDDYDWTDGLCARVTDALRSGRDEFIAYSTWKWVQIQMAVAPVYEYEFDDPPPQPAAANPAPSDKPVPPLPAYHSAEIEFVFEALPSKNLPWRPEDEKLSDMISSYWSNFAKTGNPNGPGLPEWPAYTAGADYPVMHLSTTPHAAPEEQREQFVFLDTVPAVAQPLTSD